MHSNTPIFKDIVITDKDVVITAAKMPGLHLEILGRADRFAMAALPVVIQHYHFRDPDAAYIDQIPDSTLGYIANDAMKLGKLMAEWVPEA